MASISKDPSGSRRIQFVAGRQRRTIYLGKATQRQADVVKRHVEALVIASMSGGSIETDAAAWLAKIDGIMFDKLAAVGLVEPRVPKVSATVGPFITAYIGGRTDAKPATKEVWRQGEQGLVNYFGADRPLVDVTQGDADDYKLKLVGDKLAPMTVRKRLQFAKMIFRSAVRRRLLASDPFADVGIKARKAAGRERFITPQETALLLKQCPNHHWRAVVVLARYGGLRCPSEVLSLRWQDIDWEAGRIIVQSPKTEHHPGKETRVIPLFPELVGPLRESFELAPDGAVYVVDEQMRKGAMGPSGWRNCNLRTTFNKIVRRAGLTVWPRLFHNLRSSRQTELAERFPSHVVCSWLGNSEDVARTHYYQLTEAHFEQASATQNPTHADAAQPCKTLKTSTEASSTRIKKTPVLQGVSESCSVSQSAQQNERTDGEGFEPVAPSSGETAFPPGRDAESDAVLARDLDPGRAVPPAEQAGVDRRLERLVELWPTLAEEARDRVLAVVLSCGGGGRPGDAPDGETRLKHNPAGNTLVEKSRLP